MKRSGLSLVEILLVLALLGILAALVTSNMRSYIRALQMNQAAEDVAEIFRTLGNRALTRSEEMRLRVVTGANGRLEWWATGNPAAVTTRTLENGAFVEAIAPAPADDVIVFTGRGIPDGQYVLTVRLQDRTRRVTQLVTGKVVTPR